MSLDQPQQNKMMTGAPDKKEFHFSGDGIWHNSAIVAETREEAEKLWHAAKQLIDTCNPHRGSRHENGDRAIHTRTRDHIRDTRHVTILYAGGIRAENQRE